MLKDLFKNENEINKFVDGFIEDEKKKQEKNERFIKENQDDVIEKVYQYLKVNELIDNENILYFPEQYSFSEKEFCMLFNNLMSYGLYSSKSGEEKNNGFLNQNFYLKYKEMNILMRIMWGQGTCLQMRVDLKEHWNEEFAFTYDQYKKSLKYQANNRIIEGYYERVSYKITLDRNDTVRSKSMGNQR